MYFLIFLITSLVLAIPTYGISLLVFFVIKNWYDNQAMSSLLGAAVIAMREEVSQERYHVNRAAIRKVFARFSNRPPEVHSLGNAGVTLYWGVLQHPMINNNQVFSVRFVYIPRRGTRNAVFVKAAPGFDSRVLSADDLNAISSFPILRNESTQNINFDVPKNDAEIENLIVKLAKPANLECQFPNFRFGDICSFAEKNNHRVDYPGNYSRMWFWLYIGKIEYEVHVTNLEILKKNDGGVSILAKIRTHAIRDDAVPF